MIERISASGRRLPPFCEIRASPSQRTNAKTSLHSDRERPEKDNNIVARYTVSECNSGKFSVDQERNKSISDKLNSFLGLIKNLKFLVLSTITLVILGLAIFSGDGKNIILNSYENLTGQKFQSFSPIQDFSNESYLVLTAKLSRDANLKLEDTEITIFRESDTLHLYRVALKDEVYIYKVERKKDGTWRINKE